MPKPAPAIADIDHYENFPVASFLCPPALRQPIAAIYHFARTADDVADEGHDTPGQRLQTLAAYRADLTAAAGPAPDFSPRWRSIFQPLHWAIHHYHLPVPLLHDLLDAFVQDIEKSRDGARYANQSDLLDYCRRSANPIGRLLLHLYSVHGEEALQESDAICTALQLINFWQDLSVDIPRGRYYLSVVDCARHGFTERNMLALKQTPEATQLIANCVDSAGATMLKGINLVHRIPGRAGWELRMVVQGGLRILEKIRAQGYSTLSTRPTLRWWDFPVIIWRALWM